MHLKYLVDEDFTNYKKCSMFIGTSSCTFKCEKECGIQCCQNSPLVKVQTKFIDDEVIIQRYLKNPFTKAIVIGGLEPFDTYDELLTFCRLFRQSSPDTIVIYTGWYPDEITAEVTEITQLNNIVIKYGRYIPKSEPIFDKTLGVTLASSNQFAVAY